MNSTKRDLELATQIREWMVSHGKTLSCAESCTSGRIAATLTSVSGASDYFQGGMLVYQNWLKTEYLGVSQELIDENDVVSEIVVRQMVQGCLKRFQTDFAIASTGYTGGGSDRVPRGTVWIGWGAPDDIHTLCLTTDAGREINTINAAAAAVFSFYKYIEEL